MRAGGHFFFDVLCVFFVKGQMVKFKPDEESVKKDATAAANSRGALVQEDIRVGDRTMGYKTTLGKGKCAAKGQSVSARRF